MIATPDTFPIDRWMHEIVPNVFQTMLALDAAPVAESATPATTERVVGAIGVGGESVAGSIYLQIPARLADALTCTLLGLPAEELPAPADVNDVVGELCNMVSGSFKSALSNHGNPCAMSPPSIIRGSAFAIESLPGARRETFHFDCLNQRFSLEIHLQLQDP